LIADGIFLAWEWQIGKGQPFFFEKKKQKTCISAPVATI
jgi:hypothetical protein